ncbi:MAG TPA: MMPL family transporter, partial [Thermomicrobiales bacterium]|nr:MMPL family transporter [Thermomicrobiales bacterium]
PRYGSASHEESGVWSRVGGWVARRPRPVWVATVVLLAVMATGLLGLDTTLPQEDQFRTEPDAIAGQKLIAASFPAGASVPATVITDAGAVDTVTEAAGAVPGVAAVEPRGGNDEHAMLAVTLEAEPGSQAAFDTIDRLRNAVHAVPGADAIVGGTDATSLDIARASARDSEVIMPLVLLVVVVILAALLRSIVAPLLLLATVVLSFAAALGTSVVVFDRVFGFAGMDPTTPLLAFVFLIALGIDYNIFLMGRVHEESTRIGTRAGMLRGLAVTGGVITSAGLVLAATFAVLGVLPLVAMAQLGFIVAFGVLLDTLIVRSILVPALTLDIGPHVWWPSRLARSHAVVRTERQAALPAPRTDPASWH